MSGKKAVVAGHLCIDITPVFGQQEKRTASLGELLLPGKLLNVKAPEVHTGGAVANTGLGMKFMGADVRLMGKIGKDAFGGMVREILDGYGAGAYLLEDDQEATSYTVVIAVPGIDRVFLHCPGANDTFDGTEIPESALEDAALFHFGYPTLMRKMFVEDGKYLTAMYRRMKEKGIATSLDLSMVDEDSEAGRADWKTILSHVLPYVDFFVPSFEEICFMLDRPKFEQLRRKAGNQDMTQILSVEEDIAPLAEKCLALGAKAVLLKCGAPGIYLCTSRNMGETGRALELDESKWNGYRGFEKSYKIERVLSGTGAGDCCIGAFLASILEGDGPKMAVENAVAAGALCCMSYDTAGSMKPLSQIREMIDAGWEKA